MIVEIDDQSKLEKFRRNKNKSSTVKTDANKPIRFAMEMYCLEDMECKEIYFFVILERNLWIHLLKRYINVCNFSATKNNSYGK